MFYHCFYISHIITVLSVLFTMYTDVFRKIYQLLSTLKVDWRSGFVKFAETLSDFSKFSPVMTPFETLNWHVLTAVGSWTSHQTRSSPRLGSPTLLAAHTVTSHQKLQHCTGQRLFVYRRVISSHAPELSVRSNVMALCFEPMVDPTSHSHSRPKRSISFMGGSGRGLVSPDGTLRGVHTFSYLS